MIKYSFKNQYALGFLFVCLFLGSEQITSQTLSLHSTPGGLYVSVDKVTPREVDGWQIEKLLGSGFSQGTTLNNPPEPSELGSRLEEAVLMLSFKKNNLSSEKLWQKLNDDNLNPNDYEINLPPVKLAVGTAWLDQIVQDGGRYQYRLKNKSGEIVYESEVVNYPMKIDFPEISLFMSTDDLRSPGIIWYTKKSSTIRDFEVFRTPFGKIEYEEINTTRRVGVKNDTLWLKMTDTTLTYESVFLYYMVPKDFYGNKGLPSIAVQVSNLTKQTLPVFSKLEAVGHPLRKSVVLNWKISRSERVRSLHLYRSTLYDGVYQLINELSATDTMYVDPVLTSNENYFYYFQVNDIYGNSRKSPRFFGLFKGSIIPNPPKILNVVPVEGGTKITWKGIGESIRGYYILRGEGYTGELVQISPFIPSDTSEMIYIDTSKTLKGYSPYGYSVVTESDTYVRGGNSDTLYVRPIVKTTISPPTGLNAYWRENSINLIWSDHSKIETHLAGYNVYRRQSGEEQFQLLNESLLPNTQNYYTDKLGQVETEFEYAISSVDHFGAESYKSRSKSIDLKGKIYLTPEDFWAQRSDKGVLLKWVIENTEHISGYNIYRSNDKGQIVLWKTLPSTKSEYLDTEIQKGQSKIYRISVVYSSGLESEKTKPVYMRL